MGKGTPLCAVSYGRVGLGIIKHRIHFLNMEKEETLACSGHLLGILPEENQDSFREENRVKTNSLGLDST